jgi:SAM-dependent methyltransferase
VVAPAVNSDARCLCCGADEWLDRGTAKGHPLRRCGVCGFIQALHGRPAPRVRPGRPNNIDEEVRDQVAWAADPAPAMVARQRYWLSLLRDRLGGTGDLLDVGCGAGAFLDVAVAEGWESVGQDVEPRLLADAAARGHEVRQGELAECGFAPGSFDAVTMTSVISVLYEPGDVLETIHGLLRPEGRLLITTGDMTTLRARVRRNRFFFIEPPDETGYGSVSYFTPDALTRLLRSCGYDRIELAPTYNVAYPSFPGFAPPRAPALQAAARTVRRLARAEQCVLTSP